MKSLLLLAFALTILACAETERRPVTLEKPVPAALGLSVASHDGDVYFASQPDPRALHLLAEQGVTTVVNLRRPEEMSGKVPFDEPAVVEDAGMRYVSIPISPETFSSADVDRLVEALDASPGGVLIHCASSNRVGGLWAAYLVRERGLAPDRAFDAGYGAGLRSPAMIQAYRRVIEAP